MSDRVATTAAQPALRTLLTAVVDYAGLFPPASLTMSQAVAEYARHRGEPEAWVLGRFILPSARLEEFEDEAAALLPREGARSWALSALAASDLDEDIARIEAFNERHRNARDGAVLVDTVELKAYTSRDVSRAGELLDRRFATFMEVPVGEDPAELIAAIAATQAHAKIRTGGVTPDAFPTSAQVVRFIARCIAHDVAFKATAGLHHPWRGEYRLTYAPDAPTGVMFGFLNVLLATTALHAGADEDIAKGLLDERDPGAVVFDDRGATWRGTHLSLQALAAGRERMMAFGSCSFREPVGDLRQQALL